VNDWTLARFNELRDDLLARGLFLKFCACLRRLVSPGGDLTLFEVLDTSTAEQWREAVALAEGGGAAQLGFADALAVMRGNNETITTTEAAPSPSRSALVGGRGGGGIPARPVGDLNS